MKKPKELKLKPDQVAIQCCEKHWIMMEKALDDRGMKVLVSRTALEAKKCFENAQIRIVSLLKYYESRNKSDVSLKE